jgi:predicted amidophosphoribosyltransferase
MISGEIIMICPVCKNETSSILRFCQSCNADLEEYRSQLMKGAENTGDGNGNKKKKLFGKKKA